MSNLCRIIVVIPLLNLLYLIMALLHLVAIVIYLLRLLSIIVFELLRKMARFLVTPFLMVCSLGGMLIVDQVFVDVLEEIASTRGWSGEAVELHVVDNTTGE